MNCPQHKRGRPPKNCTECARLRLVPREPKPPAVRRRVEQGLHSNLSTDALIRAVRTKVAEAEALVQLPVYEHKKCESHRTQKGRAPKECAECARMRAEREQALVQPVQQVQVQGYVRRGRQPRSLSEAQERREEFAESAVLRELNLLGMGNYGACCIHWRDAHVNGVCIECERDPGYAAHARHEFVSHLQSAGKFFAERKLQGAAEC